MNIAGGWIKISMLCAKPQACQLNRSMIADLTSGTSRALPAYSSMLIRDIITERWSEKYKRSINCARPRGFSQRAHCAGRKKTSEEQLDELSFLGSQCTKDCSGHRAGYAWSQINNPKIPNSWSPSFNKGAALQRAGK